MILTVSYCCIQVLEKCTDTGAGATSSSSHRSLSLNQIAPEPSSSLRHNSVRSNQSALKQGCSRKLRRSHSMHSMRSVQRGITRQSRYHSGDIKGGEEPSITTRAPCPDHNTHSKLSQPLFVINPAPPLLEHGLAADLAQRHQGARKACTTPITTRHSLKQHQQGLGDTEDAVLAGGTSSTHGCATCVG